MDETSRDKLSGAMCNFLSDVIHIADEGNYERDSFVKASALQGLRIQLGKIKRRTGKNGSKTNS